MNEIIFKKPASIEQIRIAKCDINPHPRIKNAPSITQSEQIKSLEIFAKDLSIPNSKYTTIASVTNLKELLAHDIIFAISNPVNTLFLKHKTLFIHFFTI